MTAGDVLWFAHDIAHMTQGYAAGRTALILGSCANCNTVANRYHGEKICDGADGPAREKLHELVELRRGHDEQEAKGAPDGAAWSLPTLPTWHRVRCSSGLCL